MWWNATEMSRSVLLSTKRPPPQSSYVGETLHYTLEHYSQHVLPDEEARQRIAGYICACNAYELDRSAQPLAHLILTAQLALPQDMLRSVPYVCPQLQEAILSTLIVDDPPAYRDFLSEISPELFCLALRPLKCLEPYFDRIFAFSGFPVCHAAICAKIFALRGQVTAEMMQCLPFMAENAYFDLLSDFIVNAREQVEARFLADKIEVDCLLCVFSVPAVRLFTCGALFSELNALKYEQKQCAKWLRRCLRSVERDLCAAAYEALRELAEARPRIVELLGSAEVGRCANAAEIAQFCGREFAAEVLEVLREVQE